MIRVFGKYLDDMWTRRPDTGRSGSERVIRDEGI